MSGDVQPRKRRDKKRRKDEGEQILNQPIHTPIPTTPVSDDVNIHVHKEGGTGGGICAKLVFFVLLSALVVVIGMIITQYRGLSDVDTVDTESKFAQIFEGWIDTGHRHDDHEVEEAVEEHEDDIENVSEDEDHEASEEEEENEDKELSEENDEDEDDESQDEDDENDEEPTVDQSEEDPIEESEENSLDEGSEEKATYGDNESEEKEEADEDEEDDQDHDEDEQELENIASDEANDEGDLADEQDSTEKASKEDEEDDDDDEGGEDKPAADDADESDEKTPATSKKIDRKDDTQIVSGEEKHQESSGMAVKLGVGVALLVVAHLVLVRKWRSAPADKPSDDLNKEPTPVKSRRNTIVAPPPLQEVEPDIEQDEEDYSDEEVSTDEETQSEPKSAKTRYQELRSTYTRSLTPEGEIDYHKEPDEDDNEEDDEENDEEDEEISEEEDEEEGESENEDYDDDDEDEELLKRLEEKYGKIPGDKQEGASAKDAEDSEDDEYEHANVTNKDDYKIKEKIDEADKLVSNNSAYAIKLYDKILQIYPLSPRSIYGKAMSLDYLADQQRSNQLLEEALQYYRRLFNTPDVPDVLFQMAAERCLNRMRFVGQYRNAINIHWKLIKRFPNNAKYLNNLAVTYLTVNRVEEARTVLKELLSKFPDDGFALVHYGFILKTTDNNLEAAVTYLKKGIETKAEGVIDGRFYFHLGDALARLGRTEEAMRVYEDGVKNDVFLSKYQRSLYNVPRLTGKPWWEKDELPYQDLYRVLTQNWQKIRDEGLAVLNEKGHFQDESENLMDVGAWKQFELFARGQKNVDNCNKCPFTCSIIEKIPEARGCKRGQTKFSVIHPGTHVWPHCGPTNCRLRLHLGLKVPPQTFIRVADEIRSWKEGKIFVFDDSFEHEVWHNGTEFRLVLIVDVWHPELTFIEKRHLSPI